MPNLSNARLLSMTLIMVGVAMSILDTTIVNTALPTMAHDLVVPFGKMVGIVISYQVSIVAFLIPLSIIGTKYGTRKTFLGGIALFGIGSCFCAISQNLATLLISRVIQGCGAAGLMSVSMALIKANWPASSLGKAMGINALVVALMTVLGPLLASLILSFASWRWLFAINLPLCGFVLLFGRRFLSETELNPLQISTSRLVAFIIILASLMYGLSNTAPISKLNLGLALGGFVLATLFILYDRKQITSVIPYHLYQDKVFALSSLTAMCAFCLQAIAFITIPFIMSRLSGHAALSGGSLLALWALAILLVAPISGPLADKLSPSKLCLGGSFLLTSGFVTLAAILKWDVNIDGLSLGVIFCGLGFGLYQAPNLREMMGRVAASESNKASALVACSRVIGQTTGAIMVSIIYVRFGTAGSLAALITGIIVGLTAISACIVRVHLTRKI